MKRISKSSFLQAAKFFFMPIFYASSDEFSEESNPALTPQEVPAFGKGSNKKFTGDLPSEDQLNDKISREIDPYIEFIEEARQRTEEALKLDPNFYCEEHHITPKFEGGSDEPSNLVLLSYNDHVIAHYIRWFVYRKPEDLVAFNVMSGQSSDVRREIAKLGGQIGGPRAQEQHKRRGVGWYDPEAQRQRGKKGAATNREQGTGAFDPKNLARAREVQREHPELYQEQREENLRKGLETQRGKGIGAFDPIQQRLKSLMRFGVIELDGRTYSLNKEHRTYVCETTLEYYLRYAPKKS